MDCNTLLRLYLFWITTLLRSATGRIFFSNVTVFYNSPDAAAVSLTERGFGFLKGGYISFNMHCPHPAPQVIPDYWLLFCNTADSRQFARLNSLQINFDCHRQGKRESKVNDAFCDRSKITHNESSPGFYGFSRFLENDYFYKFILLQCPSFPTKTNNTEKIPGKCMSELLLLNPAREHLSYDEIPMPLTYYIVSFVWVTMTTTWLGNFFLYHRYSNRLHKLISCAPMFKMVLVFVVLLRWEDISQSGVESPEVLSLCHFVQSIEDSLLFLTMMVIAEGWGIIRQDMKHYKWTSLLLMFLIFAVSLICVHWIHNYFLAFSIFCVVFMMYKTLKWCSYNIEFLHRRRRKMRQIISRCNLKFKGPVTIEDQLRQKLDMYTRFRVLSASFSMIYAIVVTLATFLSEYTYVQALTYELPELLVYLCLGFIFRLRDFTSYEEIEVVIPKVDCVVLLLPNICCHLIEPHVVLGLPLQMPEETQKKKIYLA